MVAKSSCTLKVDEVLGPGGVSEMSGSFPGVDRLVGWTESYLRREWSEEIKGWRLADSDFYKRHTKDRFFQL